MKNAHLITLGFLFLSFDNQAVAKTMLGVSVSQSETIQPVTGIKKIQAWLTRSIENSLNKANGLATNTNEEAEGKSVEIYTKKYIAYKNDAFDAGTKEGISLIAFKKKWEKVFDPNYAGIGTGYLVPTSDYGLIKVTHCNFLKKIGDTYLFETIIRDTEANKDYKRNIKVISTKNSFLITDVLEYNN